MLRINPLTLADLPALDAVQRSAYPPQLHESSPLFAAMIEAPHAITLALWDGGTLAGYVAGYPAGQDQTDFTSGPRTLDSPALMYLHDLCIAPAYQGQGHSHPLYAAFENRALAMGTRRILANAIEGRLEFWRNKGFHSIGLGRYHGVQTNLMKKDL